MEEYTIHITGLVQGVGFRPFVYRLAVERGLEGTVENRNDGVWINVRASGREIESFTDALRHKAPQAARITSVDIVKNEKSSNFQGFTILRSQDQSEEITLVSPDIAVCEACLEDMHRQKHRMDYPFVNCTNCGPRFTIIKALPYDRPRTTMQPFPMCPECAREYNDIMDRRFHAQPVACNRCGPHYTLHLGGEEISNLPLILQTAAKLLQDGGLLAIKGLGGYFLACDAMNEEAVSRLRKAKLREDKPFAVMFRDLHTLSAYARVGKAEEAALVSWQRPIVLLESIRDMALSVSMGFKTVGAMLPYMPFHYLLFRESKMKAIVLTSGNLSDEPIVIDDQRALSILGPVTDAVLTYNREIHNRVDDSVLHVIDKRPYLLRRSRGYAPGPLKIPFSVDGILATGAELVNTFCLGKENLGFPSQHIGDLKNAETYAFYTESLERYIRLFRASPRLVACDMHPDYLSTRFAQDTGLPLTRVQHHHAHIVSGMVAFGIDEPVIGVALDGTGFGTDGNIWGGEFMICDLEEFERKVHLDYVPMPGGDLAALQPWRMALSYLWTGFDDHTAFWDFPVVRWIRENKEYGLLMQMLEKHINTPLTSSTGRLFDAVAAITGICRESTFHAEAPMRLESAIEKSARGTYPWEVRDEVLDMKPVIHAVVEEMKKGTSPGVIAARFHHTMARLVADTCKRIRKDTGVNKVVLSGGTFQNRFLLSEAKHDLSSAAFEVYVSEEVPVNDGGISIGQLAVAGARKRRD